MTTDDGEHIELLLERHVDTSKQAVAEQLQQVVTEQNRKGLLHSSMTAQKSLEVLELSAVAFVRDAAHELATFAKREGTFERFERECEQFLSFLSGQFDQYVSKALGGRGSRSRAPNFYTHFSKRWDDTQSRVRRDVQILRLEWSENGADGELKTTTEPSIVPSRNMGGRPLAAHWDGMWASIAVQLWSGELHPKKQADISSAMFEWFNSQEIEVGDTAVTQRARKLWQAIQASDS